MESDENRIARLVVEAIIKNLIARKGLRQAWEGIDDEIRKDIEHTWYLKALDVTRPIIEEIKGSR